ncbi:hypothetical protein SMNI109538_21345 [Smaragdicoccus niigatensis]
MAILKVLAAVFGIIMNGAATGGSVIALLTALGG